MSPKLACHPHKHATYPTHAIHAICDMYFVQLWPIVNRILTKKSSSSRNIYKFMLHVIQNLEHAHGCHHEHYCIQQCTYLRALNASYGLDLKLSLDLYAHIKSAIFGEVLCLVSISSETSEFYEYKMNLDVEIVAPSTLLHNSKYNHFLEYCVRYISSCFHYYNLFDIWWFVDHSSVAMLL